MSDSRTPRSDQEQFRSLQRHRLVIIGVALAIIPFLAQAQAAPTLNSTVIRGSSVYSAAELFPTYREQLGKPISNDGARAIAHALAERYERDGYSRPQVRIDDGLVTAGVLRIDVLETRIGAVEISGRPGPHRERLHRLAEDLSSDRALQPAELQAVLKRMRALPGLTLSATTARDELAPNVYRLKLDTEFKPISGSVRLTNRGTDEIGPNFLLGQVVASGLLEGQTRAGLLFGAATDYDEYHGLGWLTDFAVGSGGTRASVTGFRSRSDPLEAGLDRNDRYLRDRLALRVSSAIGSSTSFDTKLSVSLNLQDLSILRDGMGLRDERLRMLEVDMSSTWRGDSSVQYLSSVELVKGLGGLNSGLDARDLSSDRRSENFSLLRLRMVRLTRFTRPWSIRLDAFAQQSAYILPYSERFKIGGDRLGRGFEVAEIAGDSGVGAKVELSRHLKEGARIYERSSVYAFYDIAAAWKQDVAGRESAASAGLGWSLQGTRLSGVLELAKPLTHADVEGRKELSLFFEATLRL